MAVEIVSKEFDHFPHNQVMEARLVLNLHYSAMNGLLMLYPADNFYF